MSFNGSVETEELRSKLIEKYSENNLDEIFSGEIIETSHGSCYKINDSRKLKLNTIPKSKAKTNRAA